MTVPRAGVESLLSGCWPYSWIGKRKPQAIQSIRMTPMDPDDESGAMAARSRRRRERLVAHRASGYADAEAWDLDFWQSQSPEDRLSALVAIRRDVEVVAAGRKDEHD